MDLKIIKEIVNELPIIGDTLISITNDYAHYKSGGKIRIDNSIDLKIGDIVKGVYHGHEIKNGKHEILVSIDHSSNGWVLAENLGDKYTTIRRSYIIEQLLKE